MGGGQGAARAVMQHAGNQGAGSIGGWGCAPDLGASRSSSSASSYAARARAGAAAALLPFGQAQEQSRQTVASLSGRAVSGQGVWRGAQRPTQRPVSTCLCRALLQGINQQQTEPGAG